MSFNDFESTTIKSPSSLTSQTTGMSHSHLDISSNLFIDIPSVLPNPNTHTHPVFTRAQLWNNPHCVDELHHSNTANLAIFSQLDQIPLPKTLKTTFKSTEWTNAMLEEISMLHNNRTWVFGTKTNNNQCGWLKVGLSC